MENEQTEEKKLTLKELQERSRKDNFEKIVSDLENYLQRDIPIVKACKIAGINPDTFYEWCKLSDEFAQKMMSAEMRLYMKGKLKLSDEVEAGNLDIIQWIFERRFKDEFSKRLEQTGADGSPLNNDDSDLKEIADDLKKLLFTDAKPINPTETTGNEGASQETGS